MMAAKFDSEAGKWSGRFALVIMGWLACSASYGTLSLTKRSAELPKVEAVAGCEHWRADKVEKVAKQAIASQYVASVPVPDAKSIPRDCPHLSGLK